MAPIKRSAPQDQPESMDVDGAGPSPKRVKSENDLERHRKWYNNMRIELEKTVTGRYRDGASNYDHVGVLLVCWEHEDLQSLGKEMQRLEEVFRNQFHFNVEIYRIPSDHTLTSLNYKVSQFALRYDSPSDLAILYYGGHGASEDNRLKLHARHKANRQGNPSVFFEDVVYALHHCDTDVLIITDCCYAAQAFTEKEVGKRKFELLTATGPENKTYGTKDPRSFTRHLCETLEELVGSEGSFTTSKLYRKLYHKADPKWKPFLFDQSSQDWGRICLAPLEASDVGGASIQNGADPAASHRSYDTILQLELRLRAKPKHHDMNELARAMSYLPHVKRIDFKRMYAPRVELEGFMRSIYRAMKIRPVVARLRERIQLRREREGRGSTPQTSELGPDSFANRSPQSPSNMYNWDDSTIGPYKPQDGTPANAVDTLQVTGSFLSPEDLFKGDQRDPSSSTADSDGSAVDEEETPPVVSEDTLPDR